MNKARNKIQLLLATACAVMVFPMTVLAAEEDPFAEVGEQVEVVDDYALAPEDGRYEAAPTSGECGANAKWSLDASGTLTISGTGTMINYPKYDDTPWFPLRESIKTIVIQEGITSIGSNSFGGITQKHSITISKSVTNIWDFAFHDSTGLASITIPDSVTSIAYATFSGCTGLTSVTIPDGVTSIGGLAFSGCTGLTSITIPDGVTSIEYSTFSGCTGLTSITIPDGVTSIEGLAFSDCTGLTSITIPDGVTGIEYSAFSGCTGLTSITIPDSVSSIGNGAFQDCKGLTSITIPARVIKINDSTFFRCTGLTSITIPDGVTSIGGSAFYGCTGLTSVTIPGSVTDIGERAFGACKGLTSITFPEGVTSIGASAFDSCTGLTSITIPDSVTSIGDWAFYVQEQTPTLIYTDSEYARSYDWEGYNRVVEFKTCSESLKPLPDFQDVPSDRFFAQPVKWAVEREITTGTSKTTFGPMDPCTRAQAMTFLYRAANGIATPTDRFDDIPSEKFYAAPVAWAVANSITTGTGANTFSPSETCTRAQIVTFLWRAKGTTNLGNDTGFSDVPADKWYSSAVKWAVTNGVTSGTGAGKFSPNDPCTRGQIVTFLYRAFK